MSQHSSAYDAHQRQRWMRHDAHRWMQPDAARWLPPGTDPADVYPALARQRDQANAAFAAKIAEGYRLIATLREEVASIRADMARRRAAQLTKYSPTQPRVPAGNPDGGQWTGQNGGQSQGTGQSLDAGQSQDADLTLPMGNVDVGDVSGSSELGDLFQITPDGTRVGGVQLAVDDGPSTYWERNSATDMQLRIMLERAISGT